MKTAEIRALLQQMCAQHGQLQAFTNRYNLNYNRLIKFLNKPGSQMLHDHAVDVVAALVAEKAASQSLNNQEAA
ncbi:hypothetical protein [uncultured Rheinheimera sp.]|uniref:hypothetical protein n=1 Tax=uncultured Rheinheimera sp. TaxID=400532 RepID=UPI0025919C74|nr:hypothetical protein [uncultured Rheinheimera sp.]